MTLKRRLERLEQIKNGQNFSIIIIEDTKSFKEISGNNTPYISTFIRGYTICIDLT